MSPTLIAKGKATVLDGETYRGVRQRFHELVLELLKSPQQAALLCCEFSNFYRSLEEGEQLDISVFQSDLTGSIQIQWEGQKSSVKPLPELGRRLQLINQKLGKSNCWSTHVEIHLNRLGGFDKTACQRILDQRTSEELSYEVSATTSRLLDTNKALSRVQEELHIAADIQKSILVSERELNKHCQGLDVGALMVPSKEVGGDLYDCIDMGNGYYCICVGDVSGKGVPASLTMSTCLTLIRSYAESMSSPSEMMGRINQRLSHNNDSCTFTTLVIGILDVVTGELRYCNAGHNPTLLLQGPKNVELLKEVHGPAVGVMEDMSYGEASIQVQPGCSVVMYSDGASEMFAPSRERYGLERMQSFFAEVESVAMPRLVRQFMRDLRDFAGSEPPHDDITILAVSLLPRMTASDDNHLLTIEIQNRIEELSRIKNSVQEYAELSHIKRPMIRKLQLVLDELLSNVIRYGCDHLPPETCIQVKLLKQGHNLLIQLRDPGKPFDPFTAPEPELDLDVEDRPIGGLGIHLVKKTVRTYRYQRLDDWNQTDLEMSV
ncbi:MAG: SpoIIE family protein phosphatase [Vulcanococcus sp.]|jgi:sigma-B regulation protein RsbU (phosphoserine phosphatase)|uniref:SpoIIE family protein phosphatase n=1 Tax=Vulcanococcus sp. TaxID=2856995 RepID=UPI003C0C90C0